MADQRTCYAGDLTSDAVGKTVRFEAGPPERRTTYTDTLVSVAHKRVASGVQSTLFLANTVFFEGLFTAVDQGLTVDHTTVVEVLP